MIDTSQYRADRDRRDHRGASRWLAPALFLLVAYALCGAPVQAQDTRPRTPSAPGAAVYFVDIKDGATVRGKFTIHFGLRGMGIAPAGVVRENSGHHHLLIDTEVPPFDREIPNDFEHVHFGGGQTEVELNLPPGPHTLQLLLGDKDHIAHDPPVLSERIRITVAAEGEQPRAPDVADKRKSAPRDAGTNDRIDVPIEQVKLPDGAIRYSVPVTIGGSEPIQAMLDTGAIGLRVLDRAIDPKRYKATNVDRDFPFPSGALLKGFIATAVVTVGDATTKKPVPFQLVQSVTCVSGKPRCPVSRVRERDYRIGGNGFAGKGFDAILGISMRTPPPPKGERAGNPLASVGDRRWIVILPQPDDSRPGQLIINPVADDVAGFRELRLSRQPARRSGEREEERGWADNKIPVCLNDVNAGERDCDPIAINTGGNKADIEPFLVFAILFDMERGVIGVKARDRQPRR